jgi:hypothetical protein
VDEDRGERDMAEDASENWLPEMEAARMKGDCRGKVNTQNESPSQEGHPNPAAKRLCQFSRMRSRRSAGGGVEEEHTLSRIPPEPIERVH